MTASPEPMSYETIRAWLLHQGVDHDDMLHAGDHFETWRVAAGLPALDESGRKASESPSINETYRNAPDGEALRPPYAYFAHWLLLAYEHVPWVDDEGVRTKIVILRRHDHSRLPEATDAEIEERTAEAMEDADMLDLPDDIEDHVREDIRWSATRHNAALAIVDLVLDRYGDALPVVLTA